LEFHAKIQTFISSQIQNDATDDRRELLKRHFIDELQHNKRLIQFVDSCEEELKLKASMGFAIPMCSLDVVRKDFV